MDIVSYILSRRYTDNSIKGISGVLAGKNCTIESATKQDGLTTIIFKWTADDGTVRRTSIQVEDGTPIYTWTSGNHYEYGDLVIYSSMFYRCITDNSDIVFDDTKWNELGSPDGNYDIVQSVNLLPVRFTSADRKMYYVINENCFYLWNGTEWEKTLSNKIANLDDVNLDELANGDVLVWDNITEKWVNKQALLQYSIMPTASADLEGRVVQFVGETKGNYVNGEIYKCVLVDGNYIWEAQPVVADNVFFSAPRQIFDINHLVLPSSGATLIDGIYTLTAPKQGSRWANYIITPADTINGIFKFKINITELNGTWRLYYIFKTTQGTTTHRAVKNIVNTGICEDSVDLNWYAVYANYDGGNFSVAIANADNSTDEITYTLVINQYDAFVGEDETEYSGKNLPQVIDMIDSKIHRVDTKGINMTTPSGEKYALQLGNNHSIKFIPQLPNNILYIGNSLLNGFGTHGMASTTVNDDYYAKINAYLVANGITPTTQKVSGSNFEACTSDAEVETWITNNLASKMSTDIQLVIIQLGDNVNTDERRTEFAKSCGTLCSYIREHCPNARVAWVASWYHNVAASVIQENCEHYGVIFVDIYDLAGVEGNTSYIGAKYIDAQGNEQTITQGGVASHPSDQGFTAITNRIIDVVFNNATNESNTESWELYNINIDELPTPSSAYLDKTYLLTSDQTGYQKGGIYQCVVNSSVYSWELINNTVLVKPEDYGAVGDGVTDDSNAFIEGDYIYNLDANKVYRITSAKLANIANNGVVGNGVIKMITEHGSEYYGNDIVNISTKAPLNRLEECVGHYCFANTFHSTSMGSRYKHQSQKVWTNEGGKYRAIAAIYYDHDKIDLLPNSFTICFGRIAMFQKNTNTNTWTLIYSGTPLADQLANYALPWSGSYHRKFNHSITAVNDHQELVIDKTELTSWLGTELDKTEGCLHLWSTNYQYSANEFEDVAVYFEAWVKEKDAAQSLQFVVGCDAIRSNSTFRQIISQPDMDMYTTKTAYWGCTMNIDNVTDDDYEQLSSLVYSLEHSIPTDDCNRQLNLLNVNDFNVTSGYFTLAHDASTDIYTFTVEPHDESVGAKFDLSQYAQAIDIKTGDKFRFYIQPLDGYYAYQGTFMYENHQQIGMSNKYTIYPNNIYSKVFIAETDASGFFFYTQAKEAAYYPHFRIWMTKGEAFVPYQKYGEPLKGLVLNGNVVDEYLENKIGNLESSLGTAASKDFTTNVSPNNHDLVESNAVYSAINNALTSVYTPRGSIACADLTSALLIDANVGDIYNTTDSGTTTALFLQGAGITINQGDTVGIIKTDPNTILFNLMGNTLDLHEYQKKNLTNPITVGGVQETDVEDALEALNNVKATQFTTMPTASADYVGAIVQYVGTTTSTYTQGYWYKCVSDGAVNPSYSWEVINTQNKATLFDVANIYNVLDYGLVGDGITDNTTALRNMLATVPWGAIVYFPKGIYNISEGITISKTVYFEGDTETQQNFFAPNQVRANQKESIINYVGNTPNITLFDITNSVGCTFRKLTLFGNSYEVNINDDEFVSLPYPYYKEHVILENVNGINRNAGRWSIEECQFNGFSGFAVKIYNNIYVKNCGFFDNKVSIIEEGTDSMIQNCYFSRCGTAVKMTNFTDSSGEHGFSNINMSDCWCDQMVDHVILSTNTGTIMINVDNMWADMIDKSAISAPNAILSNSNIQGRFSRCGMTYAGITDADEQSSVHNMSDVICVRRANNCEFNIIASKRNIGSGNNSDGICPYKLIYTMDDYQLSTSIITTDLSYTDITSNSGYRAEVHTLNYDDVEQVVLRRYDVAKVHVRPNSPIGRVTALDENRFCYDTSTKTLYRSTAANDNTAWEIVTEPIQINTLPTANVDNVGKVYIYTGATTQDYIHGGIYECQEIIPSTDPATYHWVLISSADMVEFTQQELQAMW